MESEREPEKKKENCTESVSVTMSGVVHYKFKSSRAFSSVEFSGAFIKAGALKRSIAEREGLLQSGQNLDLLLTNAQDGTGSFTSR